MIINFSFLYLFYFLGSSLYFTNILCACKLIQNRINYRFSLFTFLLSLTNCALNDSLYEFKIFIINFNFFCHFDEDIVLTHVCFCLCGY